MSEAVVGNEPTPQDQELLPCQLEVRQLCQEILALKPDKYLINYWDIPVETDPVALQAKMKDLGLDDIMLKDGDTLSFPGPNPYRPDLGLFVGEAKLEGVTVRALGLEYDKFRFDPNAPKTSPHDVIEYPGEKDWLHHLDIKLHYKGEVHSATQTITLYTSSLNDGELPTLFRDVYASVFAEQGYEGHNQVSRQVKDAQEATAFVGLVRELIDVE